MSDRQLEAVFRFLDLSPELRLTVYSLLQICHLHHRISYDITLVAVGSHLTILRTCRLVKEPAATTVDATNQRHRNNSLVGNLRLHREF